MPGATSAISHPLDGLSPDEYAQVNEILRGAEIVSGDTLYPLIELIAPPKLEVPRPTATASEVAVNITAGAVENTAPVEIGAEQESRGLAPDDVFRLPLTAGNFLSGEEEGNRLTKGRRVRLA